MEVTAFLLQLKKHQIRVPFEQLQELDFGRVKAQRGNDYSRKTWRRPVYRLRENE